MTLNIRHFESLLEKAGLPNTGDNRRLLEKCIREVMETRAPLEDMLDEAYKIFTNPEKKQEFEERVVGLLFKHC